MTIVACWYGRSFESNTITAIADSRASSYDSIKKKRMTHTDDTIKLFDIAVKIHDLNTLYQRL